MKSQTSKIASSPDSQDSPTLSDHETHPTKKQIRQRAYELHVARGGRSDPLFDWLQAERELKAEMSCLQEDHPLAGVNSPLPKS